MHKFIKLKKGNVPEKRSYHDDNGSYARHNPGDAVPLRKVGFLYPRHRILLHSWAQRCIFGPRPLLTKWLFRG